MSPQLPNEVVEAYAFANTPAYLYKKLVASDYVRQLAMQSEAALISKVKSATTDNVESIIEAYASILALLRKNANLVEVLALPTTKNLEWAPSIVSLYRQKTSSTSIERFRMPTVISDAMRSSPLSERTPYTVTKVPKHD